MAKDKRVELTREVEKLKRTAVRKAARRAKRKEKQKYRPCPCCGRYPNEDYDD